jgi:hypothetical protein
MGNLYYSNRTFVISLVITVIIIILTQFINFNKRDYLTDCPKCNRSGCKCPVKRKCQECPQQKCSKCPKCPKIPPVEVVEEETVMDIPPPTNRIGDPIRDYDYRKMFDPLEEPTRRVARHDIPPFYMKRMIDIPSRGYPDNFTQFGILKKVGDPAKNEQNNILRLFGRQEYPGSYRYEYYTGINSGLDSIKIPVEARNRKELYDGDKVYIRELDDHYEVHLHKYDAPKYYPDIIY